MRCYSCGNCFGFQECPPEKIGEEIIYSNVALRDHNKWHSTNKNRFNTKIIIFIENGGPYQFAANGPQLSSGNGCMYIRENYPTCQIRIIRFKTSISNNGHCYYIDTYFRIMVKKWKVKRQQKIQVKAILLAFRRNKKIFSFCTIYEIVAFLYPNFTFQSMKRLCT
jgi:hypothetical protein